jgi:hypothetical protein
VWRKAKYILQKLTPKIKQPGIQLAINQLFQKLKRRSTNKQGLNELNGNIVYVGFNINVCLQL